MVAMRMWLDKERVEPSKFSCRESKCGLLIRIEFRIAREAEEFTERFFQRSDGLPLAEEIGLASDGALE
jgi:hypothetical protein